jgi:hypothetical protein
LAFLFTFIGNTAYGESRTNITDIGDKFNGPQGLAVDSNGDNIYVSTDSVIEKRNIASTATTTAAVGFSYAYRVALDRNDNIYVVDTNPNHRGIYKINRGSNDPTLISANNDIMGASEITFDSSNNMYIVDSAAYKIKKFDSNGSLIGSINQRDGVYSQYEAAVDSLGNVYVKSFGGSSEYFIDKYKSDGTFIMTIKNAVFNGGMHIAVDRSNNVYISNRDQENNNVIYKMNSSGQIEVYASYQSNDPISKMTVDKNGDIYVIDGNYVKKITVSQRVKLNSIDPLTAEAGKAYSYSFASTGGIGEKIYSVPEETLPQGLRLSEDGILSGIPTVLGSKKFTITVTDVEAEESDSAVVEFSVWPKSIPAQPTEESSHTTTTDTTPVSDGPQIIVTNTNGGTLSSAPQLQLQVNTSEGGLKTAELTIAQTDAEKMAASLKDQAQQIAVINMPYPPEVSELTVNIPDLSLGSFARDGIGLTIGTPDGQVNISKEALQDFRNRGISGGLYYKFTPITDSGAKAQIMDRAAKMFPNRKVEALGSPVDITTSMPQGEKVGVSLPIPVDMLPSPELEAELLNSTGAYIEHSNGVNVLQRFNRIDFPNRKPVGIIPQTDFSKFTIVRLSQKRTDEGSWENDEQGWKYIQNGEPVTGWNQIGSSWYLMGSDGTMKIGWEEVDGKWYYLNSDGTLAKNTVVDGHTLNEDGVSIS